MPQERQNKAAFLATFRVEIITAVVILVLGVSLGLALPADQSMPNVFSRIITVISPLQCKPLP